MSDPVTEADQVEGTPHPRETRTLFGQDAAERDFLSAWRGGKLHHAWLITGPRGVGKATLAWRIARFLLSRDAGEARAEETLDVAWDHPAARRLRALSEPGLFLLRRPRDEKTGKLRQVITIEEARELRRYLTLSRTDGGRRVVLIDAADDLNTASSNAILKLLEEPPARTTLLLVCHAPARLLPTIRSRCRTLRCLPLGGGDMAAALEGAGLSPDAAPAALAELASGSVGMAARLIDADGPALYGALADLLRGAPGMDRPRLLRFAETAGGPTNAAGFDTVSGLIGLALSRLARNGAGHPPDAEAAPGEAEMLLRLSPDIAAARRWASLQQELGARMAHGRAVNLDPSSLILDTMLAIDETAAGLVPA
ncbi:DNA polymerase III subunit delta' [Profundibacterium mesophilum]|uniref:DNA polymerase III delta prime subunit n=1 Tax=Profundibacterium mesophilum KAUST100406-0324 TaxID=1037889 RepID=A0A921TD96_9RHOB|nr:DNA polymerase III subunit delta' [Profundibacterium mesophilum]KAF0676096.1 DNA polymerase III delta prime subunit [Profundibacterium mesophilum KAUST100406-0324]